MTKTEFAEICKSIIDKTSKTLVQKNQEYTDGINHLQNFQDAAVMSQISQEQVLWFYCLKHLVSVKDIIFNKGIQNVSKELLQEKTGDIINYMIILNAIKEDYERKS